MNRRAGAAALACAVFSAALACLAPAAGADDERLFQFEDRRIVESSGLAASAVHDGVVYTHNDSDDGPYVYAVDGEGKTVATLTLPDAPARDWEAIAPGPGPDGKPSLFVGDIGDNITGWDEIRVMRFAEPDKLADGEVDYKLFRFRYADSKSRNAEALLVHPKTGRLYVVSKNDQGGAVYRAPETLKTGSINILRKVADAPATVTDGAFTLDGEHAVLRGYFYADIVDPGRDWAKVDKLQAPWGMQGESVAATRDAEAMMFGSEGLGSSVYRVELPEKIGESARPSPSPSKSSGTKKKPAKSASPGPEKKDSEDSKDSKDGDSHEGLPFVDGRTVAGVGAVSLGVLILVLFVRRG